jgi:ATP:corrinoid adenosyltransferase
MLKTSVYPRVARETPSKGEVRSMEQGFLQIYTGKGKGKTTAALGLAMRAAGRGLRVYFGQFIKDYPYSEVQVLAERFPEVTVEQFGTGEGCLVDRDETAADREAAARGVAADAAFFAPWATAPLTTAFGISITSPVFTA